jgi:hypothetical protein
MSKRTTPTGEFIYYLPLVSYSTISGMLNLDYKGEMCGKLAEMCGKLGKLAARNSLSTSASGVGRLFSLFG